MGTDVVQPQKATPSRAARWAWVAIIATPIGLALGVVVMFLVAAALDVDLFEAGSYTGWENLLMVGPAVLIWMTPPITGTVLGVRSAREGSRAGLVAAVVGALLTAGGLAMSVSQLATY